MLLLLCDAALEPSEASPAAYGVPGRAQVLVAPSKRIPGRLC